MPVKDQVSLKCIERPTPEGTTKPLQSDKVYQSKWDFFPPFIDWLNLRLAVGIQPAEENQHEAKKLVDT